MKNERTEPYEKAPHPYFFVVVYTEAFNRTAAEHMSHQLQFLCPVRAVCISVPFPSLVDGMLSFRFCSWFLLGIPNLLAWSLLWTVQALSIWTHNSSMACEWGLAMHDLFCCDFG